MMTTHAQEDINQAAIRINRPAPRVVLLLAALFFSSIYCTVLASTLC
jgi:hypothetical protein